MYTRILTSVTVVLLIATFIFVAPQVVFAQHFLDSSKIGPGGGGTSNGSGSQTGDKPDNGGPANRSGGSTSNGSGSQTGVKPDNGTPGAALGKLAPRADRYGCYGVTCNNQDPAVMGCNRSYMTFAPFKIVDAAGRVLATGQNVYSVGCRANWTEGTLTAIGRNIVIGISATDSRGKMVRNCFPHDPGGIIGYNCNLNGYNGASGWPAFSDMVDGTHLTNSFAQATGPDGKVYLGSTVQ